MSKQLQPRQAVEIQAVRPQRGNHAPDNARTCSSSNTFLHRALGNRQASHSESVIQTKLEVGEAHDEYEREADRVADRVMSMALPGAPPEDVTPSGRSVQRQCDDCRREEGVLRRKTKPSYSGGAVRAHAGDSINLRGGSPLRPAERSFFEPRFGADFGNVLLHTGEDANALSRRFSARAFTYGNNIVFANGEYRPDSPAGRRLLAHELTHVVQQGQSLRARGTIQRDRDGATGEAYDPRREILSLGAFDRRYPEILNAFNDLNAAMDELHWAVEAYGPRGFGFSELQARYARARGRWEEANGLLDQYWSIARVMVAVGRANGILVVVNAMRRAQAAATRPGFGAVSEFSLLTRPHQHALAARNRVNDALAGREETQRVHEAVAEEIERERAAAREREAAPRRRSVAQTAGDLRAYVRDNYSAITEEGNRLRFALAVARLLYANMGNVTAQYIQLFTRLESESREFYTLILFRGATISYLADMGVEGLAAHVYREADRSGAHMLLGAWDFDETTGEQRESAAWLLLLDILVGIVPVVGQVADVRDISGYMYRLGKYPAQRSNGWTWLGLVGSVIGLIPAAGDGAKSLLAAIRRVAVDLPVGRLSDDVVSGVARYLDAGTLQRIVDVTDDFSRMLTVRWTVIQGGALNRWDRIVAEMGPVLTRVSDLTASELALARRAAQQHLPEALQQAGVWLGQLVRSFWVSARLSLQHDAEDIIDMIRAFREQWQLTGQAAHELWSPTARFLAQLTPAERAAVRSRLLVLAARESDEILQGVRRLVGDAPEGAPVLPGTAVEAIPPSPVRPRVDEPPAVESAATRTATAETRPGSAAPESAVPESVASRPPTAMRGHSAAMPHEQMLEVFTRATRRPGPGREVYNVYDSIEAYDDAWRAASGDLMGDLPQGFVHNGIIHLPPNASTLTVLHETLHWASRQSGARTLLGRFVEEGMVESFARRIAGPEAGHVYEANVSFVDELARVVGREALDGALLHAQWGRLRRALDAHFGSAQRTQQFYGLLRRINDSGEPAELLDQARRMLARLADDATLPDIRLPGTGPMSRADDAVSARPPATREALPEGTHSVVDESDEVLEAPRIVAPDPLAALAQLARTTDPHEAYVYRILNADNEVIYYGISTDPIARLRSHASSQGWAHEIHSIEVINHPYRRPDALSLETDLIREAIRHGYRIYNQVEDTVSQALGGRGGSFAGEIQVPLQLAPWTRIGG